MNEPGSTWYKMPTTGICSDMIEGLIDYSENDCAFYDSSSTSLDEGLTVWLVPVRPVQSPAKSCSSRLTDRPTFAYPCSGLKASRSAYTQEQEDGTKRSSAHTRLIYILAILIVHLVQSHCAKVDADCYVVDRQRGE
jgi:hypothetical protein